MVSLRKTKDNPTKKESDYMLNEEICELREKLNESIINGDDYTVTYKLSIELDELIAKYYKVGNTVKSKVHKKNTSMVIMI